MLIQALPHGIDGCTKVDAESLRAMLHELWEEVAMSSSASSEALAQTNTHFYRNKQTYNKHRTTELDK